MTREGPMGRARRAGLRTGAAAERKRAIDALVERAAMQGACTDRLFWTMHYDFELAPLTSNLEQLREVGVYMPPEADLPEGSLLHRHLWEVIETLADLGIYLLRTDHLSDRELYQLLEGRILREPVRDLPPSEGVSEFIDVGVWAGSDAPKVSDRDRLLPRPESGTPPT
ncbi:MAG: hypothetical protein ACOYMI_06930 [Phycisphaerales bacterium]